MRLGSVLCLLLFPAALVTYASPAWAQSCGGSAGACLAGGAATEGPWLDRGRAIARLTEQYEVKDRSYKGAHVVANDFDESLFISRTNLDVRYGVTDDWTAELTVTYPHFTYRLKPPGGTRTVLRSRGPGDTALWVGRRIGLGDEPMTHAAPAYGLPIAPTETPSAPVLSFWAGVSLPTGTAEKPNPAFVTRDVSVANIQTGTGTFDPLFRARIDWPNAKWLPFGTPFAEADVQLPLYENRFRYRTADAESVAVGVSAPIAPKFSASVVLTFQHNGRDQFRGEDVGVGGARWLYFGPGVAWQFSDDASIDLGVRTPLYRRTQTKLSDSTIVWQIGLNWAF